MKRNAKFKRERHIGVAIPGGRLIDYRPPETTVVLGPRRSGGGPTFAKARKVNSIGRPLAVRRAK